MSKILVTGATGHLGKVVTEELLKRTDAANIAVLVRDPDKAAAWQAKGVKVFKGDYNDYNSLVTAFQGIDKLYFISGNDVTGRISQHENVVNAAVAAKVKHVFYTSYQHETEVGVSAVGIVAEAHLATEKWLKASGLAYTILAHALYADVLPMFLGEKILESGTIFLPAGDGKAPYATRYDMGVAGAILLLGAGHENKTYNLAADTSYSFNDIARQLSELSGKQIQYIPASTADFTAQLTQAGVPVEGIHILAGFSEAIAQGEFDFPDTTLEQLLGRKPEPLKAFLKTAYGL